MWNLWLLIPVLIAFRFPRGSTGVGLLYEGKVRITNVSRYVMHAHIMRHRQPVRLKGRCKEMESSALFWASKSRVILTLLALGSQR
ncbi:hypothetical protein F4818DRAFT_183007 [Hypoxylon cercidicola]|nr:hypothetical protein F4818DRAFT_183007 [Hypoxylon cercidicola]